MFKWISAEGLIVILVGLANLYYLVANKHLDLKKRIRKEHEENYIKNVQVSIESIYLILESLLEKLNAYRVLILYIHNSGDNQSTYNNQKVTILYEQIHPSHNEYIHRLKSDYQSYLLDASYAKMMTKIVTAGYFEYPEDKLEPGFLQDLYEIESVKKGFVFYITIFKKNTYILSIRWKDGDGDTPNRIKIIHELRVACAKLAPLLEKSID